MLVKYALLPNFSHDRTDDRGSVFYCHCLFTTYAIITIYPHYTNYFDGKVEKTASYFLFPFYSTDILFDIGMTIQTNFFNNYLPFDLSTFLPLYIEQVYIFRKYEDFLKNQRAISNILSQKKSSPYFYRYCYLPTLFQTSYIFFIWISE